MLAYNLILWRHYFFPNCGSLLSKDYRLRQVDIKVANRVCLCGLGTVSHALAGMWLPPPPSAAKTGTGPGQHVTMHRKTSWLFMEPER